MILNSIVSYFLKGRKRDLCIGQALRKGVLNSVCVLIYISLVVFICLSAKWVKIFSRTITEMFAVAMSVGCPTLSVCSGPLVMHVGCAPQRIILLFER